MTCSWRICDNFVFFVVLFLCFFLTILFWVRYALAVWCFTRLSAQMCRMAKTVKTEHHMSGNVWQVCLWYAWVIVCKRMSTRCGHVPMRGKVWRGLSVSKNTMHILSTQKRKQIQSIKLNLRCLVQHPTSAGVRLHLPTFAFVCLSVPMSAYVRIYLPTSAHVRGRRMPMHAYEILRSPTDAHDPVGCKKFVERLDMHGFEKHRKNEIRFEKYKKNV